MSNDDDIKFRKKALEYANRPSSLDDALRVITPPQWLTLSIVFLIIIGFFMWLIWGKIFVTLSGKGILLSVAGDVVTVEAPSQKGLVETLKIKQGQKIKKGDLILTLDNELLDKIHLKEIYLNELKEQQRTLKITSAKELELIKKNTDEQIAKAILSLEIAKQKLEQLKILLGLKELNLKKGVLDLPNVTATRVEYYGYLQEISARESELVAVKLKYVELSDKWFERERSLALTIYREEYDYNLLKKQWEESYTLRSPTDGIVAGLRVSPGDYVKPGQNLVDIVPDNQNLYALVLVPAEKGKLLNVGMYAQVLPTQINQLEYGVIKGKVESYSLFPVSPDYISSQLNIAPIHVFLGVKSPMISVKIALQKNAETVSGYSWSTSKGPSTKLTQGTLVTANIVVEQKRPIEILVGSIMHAIPNVGQ